MFDHQILQIELHFTMEDLLEKHAGEKEELVQSAGEGKTEQISQLIEAGADVNTPDKFGNFAIHKASTKGHPKCLELLIKAGTNVNKCDKMTRTPITQAAMHGNGDCVQLLAESGADVNSALLTVAHLGHSVAVNLLIQAGAVVSIRNLSGNSPLILAAQRSDAKSLDVLVKAGADVNYRNSDWERNEYSALEEAIEDYSTSHLLAEKLQCIHLLLKAGARVNSRALLHI